MHCVCHYIYHIQYSKRHFQGLQNGFTPFFLFISRFSVFFFFQFVWPYVPSLWFRFSLVWFDSVGNVCIFGCYFFTSFSGFLFYSIPPKLDLIFIMLEKHYKLERYIPKMIWINFGGLV